MARSDPSFRAVLVAGYKRAWAKYKAIGMAGGNCRGRWVRSWHRYEVLSESGVFLPNVKAEPCGCLARGLRKQSP